MLLHFPTRRASIAARKSLGRSDSISAAKRRGFVRLDGRSAQAVAIRKRIATYAKAIGEAAGEPAVKARITELAQLETLALRLRLDSLAGRDVDLTELNRLVRTTDRLRRSLRLSEPPPLPPLPRLPLTLKAALAQ